MEEPEVKCLKCNNNENFHFNYDWASEHKAPDEVICNECHARFKIEYDIAASIKLLDVTRVLGGLLLDAKFINGTVNVNDYVCFSNVNQYKIYDIDIITKDGIGFRILMPNRKWTQECGMNINEFKAFLDNFKNKELKIINYNKWKLSIN